MTRTESQSDVFTSVFQNNSTSPPSMIWRDLHDRVDCMVLWELLKRCKFYFCMYIYLLNTSGKLRAT
ncbi:unnamed protein product [Arctia plantaginis]|uniref:Uncharacterized protein n=1 Tax=Arctia plantaginis TaxID=874455 RepID=A0A8S1BHV8_ARCPL|nr:unnamed protein product [Arctia plantaginis]